MIISEKQVMQLMAICSDVTKEKEKCFPIEYRAKANELLHEIQRQQSEELKVIE